MKQFLFFWGLFLTTLVSRAQQEYFIFIQGENSQPFYIQLNEKMLSSSASGHLIISGLKDSSYLITVGFPKNQHQEQIFQVSINRKDGGYQLRNLGAEGWALFNLQTSQLIKAQQIDRKQTISYGEVRKSDVFSVLMASLVNDSAVLYTSLAKAEPVAEIPKASIKDLPEQKLEIAKKEEPTVKDTQVTDNKIFMPPPPALPTVEKLASDTSLEFKIKDTEAKAPEVKPAELKALIVWFSEKKINTGTELVFFDLTIPDKIDTIKILIPNDLDPGKEEEGKKGDEKIKEPERKKENEKSGASKFIAKIFGKKTDSNVSQTDSAGKTTPPQHSISVKVSNVEKEGSPGSFSSSAKEEKKENVDTKQEQPKKEVEKTGASKFFTKIFGKKSGTNSSNADSAGKTEPIQHTISVKVTNVDSSASSPTVPSPVTEASRQDGGASPGEPKSEEKTGGTKLFTRLFGKKSNRNSTGVETNIKTDSVQNPAPPPVNSSKNVQSLDSQNLGEKKITLVNSDCRLFATDADIDKLRLKMVDEKDADGQIMEARKFFKTRCVTTNQVRILTRLFLTDEGKYRLFDAAYTFVSDLVNFKQLVSLLADEYYINRFKAMVRQ